MRVHVGWPESARDLGVARDERGVTASVQRVPRPHGFCRKAAVGKRDHERRARPQHARDLGEHFGGAREVLHAYAADRGVECRIGIRQRGVSVEALHDALAQARVGR